MSMDAVDRAGTDRTAADDQAPVLNVAAYRFVEVADTAALAETVRAQVSARDLRGTVLVAEEGINLFLAGAPAQVRGLLDWLRSDPRFVGLVAKESWSAHVPFARLKVKRKRAIIPFRDGAGAAVRCDTPVPSLDPRTLARWIAAGHDDAGRPLVLLDTRNREETAQGSFAGALTLPIDDFAQLPAALDARREALAGAAVVGFCTGGIRCEKAVPWMRANGYGDVLQLEGGILGYFEQVGGQGYAGRCFVFDERVALDPALRPLVDRPVAPV